MYININPIISTFFIETNKMHELDTPSQDFTVIDMCTHE